MQVNILEAKNRLSQLIKVAQSGQSVVIANRGQPVAQLTAAPSAMVHAKQGRKEHGNVSLWLQTTRLPQHARRTAEEIDLELARERGAWD